MSYLTSRDGTRLYQRVWSDKGAATLILLHGYGDHIERYDRDARELAAAGFAVRGFDYRGHGQSDGLRGHIRFFSEYLDDLTAVLDAARDASPAPCFLVAHSHGALISLRYLLEYPRAVHGIAALSPYLKLALTPPKWQIGLGRMVSSIIPSLALPSGLKGVDMAQDPAVAADYDNDPRNFKIARARWFTESTAAQAEVAARAAEINVPSLFLIPGADKVANPTFAREVFERLGSADKECQVFEGLYHEILNEPPPGRTDVMTRLKGWLQKHQVS
jgi:alpha-beta hydrolase superfamily lysophospholipase